MRLGRILLDRLTEVLLIRRFSAACDSPWLLLSPPLVAQSIPTPLEHFGHEIGADRQLADWEDLTSYFERLAGSSDRVVVDTLGPTTVGHPFVMLTITSPENQARLEELHAIQMKLADPRTISGDAELQQLLDEGKTVVLITQGIHATEVGASQMSANLAYELASSDSEKVGEILDNVILLQIPSLNPDGCSGWLSGIQTLSARSTKPHHSRGCTSTTSVTTTTATGTPSLSRRPF